MYYMVRKMQRTRQGPCIYMVTSQYGDFGVPRIPGNRSKCGLECRSFTLVFLSFPPFSCSSSDKAKAQNDVVEIIVVLGLNLSRNFCKPQVIRAL